MANRKNNFYNLIRLITRAGSISRYQQAYTTVLRKHGTDMIRELVAKGPVGQVEPDYTWVRADGTTGVVSHERPSLRQHDTTLADSIIRRAGISNTQTGVRMAIEIDHPTVGSSYGGTNIFDWLSRGTKRHDIPYAAPFVSFWWGPELRWPPLDGDPPGGRVFSVIDHPGVQTPNPWIETAKKNFIRRVKPDLTKATQRIWSSTIAKARYIGRTSGS